MRDTMPLYKGMVEFACLADGVILMLQFKLFRYKM